MEQHRTHRQQLAHRAHDSPSFDMLPSPFYPTFPVILGGASRATQQPHPSTQYAQQHYPPDGGPPLEAQRSPPRPYGLQEHPGHPHLGDPAPSPALQQPQPRPAAAYPLFPQDNESHNSAFQVPDPQQSRAPAHQLPQHLSIQPGSIDPCYFGAFYDNAGGHSRVGITRLPDLTYAHHPQQRYSLPTTHHSTAIHTPPETSPTTAVPGPSQTFPEQHDNGTNADATQRSRQWGGAGALNPATGVFSRASDHPRVRTAQACEKCRARKAKVCCSIFFSPSPPPSYALSDKHPPMGMLSAQAITRHASGVKRVDWSAPTRQNAVCAGPTSQSLRSPRSQTARNPPKLRKDRKRADVPLPCPLPHAGTRSYGVSTSNNRSTNKTSTSTNTKALPRLPLPLAPRPLPPLHLPRAVGASDILHRPNPKLRL
jgi:hypothetical protein